MDILDPEEIKNDKDETAEEAIKRVHKMREEESRLAGMTNTARDKAKKVIEEINEELEDFKNQIKIKRARLIDEIDGLEIKRKKLLEPIDDIRLEAEGYLEDAKTELKKVDKEKIINANVSKNNEDFGENLEAEKLLLVDREDDIIFKENDIDKREDEAIQSESALKINWRKYTKTIDKLNIKVDWLEKIEDDLKIRERLIEDRAVAQAKRTKEIDKIERQNISEREAIEQAKIHLGINL